MVEIFPMIMVNLFVMFPTMYLLKYHRFPTMYLPEISPVEAGPSRQDNVEKDARNADSDDLSKLGSR